ncbi:hypothetical protein LCM4576_08390 [Mesorhizobium sp. LCM 4576]|uniref:hypothetical protein n=1 Tax=Mesorhizobium sp. LCM 4576 TaxID=1848289 RepID=UPI0008D8EC09|nr:hypothetical protein [Mesorhizobium sp. LCM 4576]OHV58143.1 hypothetical protein LCM4576_08390 [Mesorhizobium sp. LCM 4576]
MTEISNTEIEAAERWLASYLIGNGKPIRLPSILRSAVKAGHKWRHVLRARFKPSNGIVAARNRDGEWTWTLSTGEQKEAA